MPKYFMTVVLFVASLVSSAANSAPALYVCESAEPEFLGKYTASEESKQDGVPIYSNANDRSFFRNNKFWYLGNLGPWPPVTHYRCVEPEGCSYGEDFPPSSTDGVWHASKVHGKEPIPVISKEPCPSTDKDEL